MSYHDETSESDRPKAARWLLIGGALALLGGGVAIVRTLMGNSGPAPRAQEVTLVKIVLPPAPPPLPPPPPPPEQKIVEEKMIEQVPVDQPEAKPEAKPAPDAGIGTSIKGDGAADGFGLSGNGGGGAGGGGPAKPAGSRWGWYAGQVQSAISDALRRDAETRGADFRIQVRLWSNSSGRIERAQLTDSTGNAALDQALQSRILTGLRLPEPPPADMPMPIVLRLTARRSLP